MTCPKCNDDLGKTANNDEFCKGCGKFINACSCEKKPERVSIIIPVYNAEKYIGSAIRNALRQTYSNIEVIVVDDGSTDKTILNLIRDPLSKNIKIIEKENGGVGSALNAGIKQMTGTWFKWLSADDLLERDCIATMMNYIKQDTNIENKIYYTHYRIITENDEFVSNFIEPDRNDYSYLDKCAILLNNYYGNATTSLMHKSVIDKTGLFNEQIRNGDDYDFWLRALFSHKIELHLIPKILASYRKHPEQLTNTRGVELYQTVEKIRENNLLLLDDNFRKQVLTKAKSLQILPLKVKVRRKIRNVVFSMMPNKFNNKILSQYKQRRKL